MDEKRNKLWNESKNDWLASLPDASSVTAKESGCFNDGWFRGYDAAAGQQQWVDVADRLPTASCRVIAVWRVGEATDTGEIDFFNKRFQVYRDDEWQDVPDVIAWMPMPKYQRPSAVAVEGEGAKDEKAT